jgi:SAM-dependent methyltransferase
LNSNLFTWIDNLFCSIDKTQIRRTKNIRLIPDFKNRRGGKLSYAEWAHVIGIFQTVIYQTLAKKTGNNILDIGCGTGLLGISSEPFIADGGTYTGIDVMQEDISFCKKHFTTQNYKFIHLNVANATYANDQPKQLEKWPIADKSQDLVTALSVWTHFSEDDALFYMKEIYRVLKDGGKAIVTFFFLNEDYQQSLSERKDDTGRFHSTNQNTWVFNKSAYNSENWFTVPSARNPEDAIGVTETGMGLLLENSGLKLEQYYPGNWKEMPGVFFQDIMIFIK